MRILPVLAVLGSALAGCARDPGLCCDEFSPSDDAGIYCNAHKDAVLRYVGAAKDPKVRQARIEWVTGLLKAVEPLPDSDEVHAEVARHQRKNPEFWAEYEKQHFWAGRDTNLGLERRAELMKSGFRHALTVLGREPR